MEQRPGTKTQRARLGEYSSSPQKGNSPSFNAAVLTITTCEEHFVHVIRKKKLYQQEKAHVINTKHEFSNKLRFLLTSKRTKASEKKTSKTIQYTKTEKQIKPLSIHKTNENNY